MWSFRKKHFGQHLLTLVLTKMCLNLKNRSNFRPKYEGAKWPGGVLLWGIWPWYLGERHFKAPFGRSQTHRVLMWVHVSISKVKNREKCDFWLFLVAYFAQEKVSLFFKDFFNPDCNFWYVGHMITCDTVFESWDVELFKT